MQEPSTVLMVMQKGGRLSLDKSRGAVAIHVVTGQIELHVGDEDVWDELPYDVRHIEGACSFYALFDRGIDVPQGTLLDVDPALLHDIEAVDDSAFFVELRAA